MKKMYTKEEIASARVKLRDARRTMREAWKEATKIIPGYGRRRHRRYISGEQLEKKLASLEKRIAKRLDQLGARVKRLAGRFVAHPKPGLKRS